MSLTDSDRAAIDTVRAANAAFRDHETRGVTVAALQAVADSEHLLALLADELYEHGQYVATDLLAAALRRLAAHIGEQG